MSKNFDISLKIPTEIKSFNSISNNITSDNFNTTNDNEEFDFAWCHGDYYFCRYWYWH